MNAKGWWMVHWKAAQLSADFGISNGVKFETILHK
jgi:hypothetical protein